MGRWHFNYRNKAMHMPLKQQNTGNYKTQKKAPQSAAIAQADAVLLRQRVTASWLGLRATPTTL